MNLKKLTDNLDRIASTLQKAGMVREATEIDAVSNTLDEIQKEANISAKEAISIVDYVTDAIETLYASQIGNRPEVNNMYRAFQSAKRSLEEPGADLSSFLNTREVKAFTNWLKAGTGKRIPDRYFRDNHNKFNSTWDQLAGFLNILNVEESNPKTQRMENKFQDFMKDKDNAPTEKKWKGEEQIFKQAGFHDVPREYTKYLSLLYALKQKEY